MIKSKYPRALIAALASALCLGSGCNPQKQAEKYPAYSLEDTVETKERIKNIEGFGRIYKANSADFPVKMHDLYRTESGHYIGKLGAKLYAIDGKSGKVLTHGGQAIKRLKEGFELKIGNNAYLDSTPRRYKEFKDSGLEEKFEEREDGLYIRNWKSYSKS